MSDGFVVNSAAATRALVALCFVTALTWVIASDVVVALPTIAQALGTSMDELSWAVNGYMLAGAAIIVGGKLGDVFGRRNMVTLGVLLTLAGSAVSAVAPSAEVLILGRVVQGLGAALVLPAALATVVVMFSGPARAKAVSAWIVTCWAAQASGTLVGGSIVSFLDWRVLFWVNVPLLLAGAAWVWKVTPPTSMPGIPRRIDVAGAVLGVGAVAVGCYAMVVADQASTWQVVSLLGVAALMVAAFIWWERKASAPLVDLSIFFRRRFDGATFANLSVNVAFAGVLFLMALYLQVVGGFSPLVAGALLLPATVPILLLNPVGVRLFERFGPALPTAVGMALVAVGAGSLFFITDSYWSVVVPFVLLGAGVGLQIGPCAAAAVDDPGPAGEGVAAGLFKASSMVGSAVGVALVTMVFQMSSMSELASRFPSWSSDQFSSALAVLTGSVAAAASTLPDGVAATLTVVFDNATSTAVLPLAALAAVATVAAFFLLRGTSAGLEDDDVQAAAELTG